VLWNKNRADPICDPRPAYALAEKGVSVVSTFVPPDIPRQRVPSNLRITGSIPFAEMRQLVLNAEVYLATTQEVDSLSVKEAMGAGVPVLGYAWGGTAEVVRHKIEGYLVEPGDIDGLLEGLEWIRSNRDACSKAARARAQEYAWPKIIEQYANLYRDVYNRKQAEKQTVAAVISCYNYGHYLAQALESVLAQTRKPDEIIIVDDGSTDNTREIALGYAAVAKLISQSNSGVAHARNAGVAATNCEFIVCLDADDKLDRRYIETLLPAFTNDRALGVAWSKVAHITEQGQLTETVWDFNFKWEDQAHPDPKTGGIRNGIPCAAMFRREMWERAGGYKQVYHPAEDAEFWLRGLSTGFTARRVSDEPLFLYRQHEGSASRTKRYGSIHHWHPWSVDRQYPFAAPSEKQPAIRSYHKPAVSVVIPVGPGHARYLSSALDSLLGQTCRSWEVIVVDDTGNFSETVDILKPYPFVKVPAVVGRGSGAGVARNYGLKHAKAPLVLWLDADDYLLPNALEEMLKAYTSSGGKYVYSDWLKLEEGKPLTEHQVPEYDAVAWLTKGQHAVTVLMETEQARAIGGFDEELPGWEDWDFFVKMAINGFHGVRVPKPLFGYRYATGTRREESFKRKDELLPLIRERYRAYIEGDEPLMACGCGKNANALKAAQAAIDGVPGMLAAQAQSDKVTLQFIGEETGTLTYMVNGRRYQAANNPFDRFIQAPPEDVQRLLSFGKFQVAQPQAVAS
jgi:glycosyltransferase involved in cell wall biosynthesis